jgi:hypothetical protein
MACRLVSRICTCAAFTSNVRTIRMISCLFIVTAPPNSLRETSVGCSALVE